MTRCLGHRSLGVLLSAYGALEVFGIHGGVFKLALIFHFGLQRGEVRETVLDLRCALERFIIGVISLDVILDYLLASRAGSIPASAPYGTSLLH